MTLVLRQTKGFALTYVELDNNFSYLETLIGGVAGSTDLSYNVTTRLLSSSTGTDVTLPLVDTTNAGLMSAADKTKLNGIAAGATVSLFSPAYQAQLDAMATNAQLRDRATHTGTQLATTISNFNSSVNALLSRFYDINVFVAGLALADEIVFRMKAVRDFSFPIDFVGSTGEAETGSSANVIFRFFKNGTQFGTLRFNVSTSGVYVAATATSFAVGDILMIRAPTTPDISLRNVSITLLGTV